MNLNHRSQIKDRPIISLNKFCRDAGISRVTGWRWRRNGWLVTYNIAGRAYLTETSLNEFLRRLEAGEFAKEPGNPGRNRKAVIGR